MAMPRGGRRPGAGRPAGSRNKRTREMTERLDRLGLDPIAALVRLAQYAEAEGNLDLAERAWRGLLPYAGPRPTLSREGFSAPEKGLPAEGISRSEKTPASAIPRRGTS
jgi:hypothetical protein